MAIARRLVLTNASRAKTMSACFPTFWPLAAYTEAYIGGSCVLVGLITTCTQALVSHIARHNRRRYLRSIDLTSLLSKTTDYTVSVGVV